MIERVLTVKDVAREYSVHLQTVYLWIKRGDLVPMRLPGGDYRFRPDDLYAFEALCRGRGILARSTDSASEAESGSSAGRTRQPVTPEPYQRGRLSGVRPRNGETNG